MVISIFKKSALYAIFLLTGFTYSQQLAFPTAEGYGKFTKGGRGGKVCEVTNLNDAGEGSLRAAIAVKGPRTVVFRVSGTIKLKSDLVITKDNPYITIAGQTAPGDGICITRTLVILADEVILRYFRARVDALGDAVGGAEIENVIVDHLSCSWSNDELMSIYVSKNLTIQYCLLSEPCQREGGHRFGGIWGAQNGTYHHNAFVHNESRTPRFAGKTNETNDYRNNINYNWGPGGCYGPRDGDKINIVANYFKPGPASKNRSRIAMTNSGGAWHVSKNIVVGSDEVTNDNYKGLDGDKYTKLNEPWPAMPIKEETAEEAFKTFLEHGGCSFPVRDAVDKRIIEEMRTGTATYGNNGLIDKPSDVGGWPELKSLPAPADGDHDGMPDEWETKNGLNPNDASDGSKTGKDGYTNLENYLNGLIAGNGSVAITAQPAKSILKPALNYLNTFNSSSTVHYSIQSKSKVKLDVFSLAGKFVTTLINEVKEPGEYSENINKAGLTNGLYLYKLTADNQSISSKKMY